MATSTHVAAAPWPAARVSRYLRWKNLGLLVGPGGLFTRVVYEDERSDVGATRTLWMEEGPPVRERLEAYDDRDPDYFSFTYRAIDTGPLPVTDYVGRICVTAAGPDACTLRFHCDYTPVGIAEAQWSDFYHRAEDRLLRAILARLELE